MTLNISIENKNEEKLFDRVRVIGTVKSEATPSRKAVLEALAKQLKCNESILSIRSISQSFGTKGSKVEAFMYSTPEAKTKFDRAHLAKRTPVEKPAAEAKTE